MISPALGKLMFLLLAGEGDVGDQVPHRIHGKAFFDVFGSFGATCAQ
jgi:hypothetical protein